MHSFSFVGINWIWKLHAVPPPPSDLEVKKVADKLALFVAKNGRQFEDLTRRKNSENPLFRCGRVSGDECVNHFETHVYFSHKENVF